MEPWRALKHIDWILTAAVFLLTALGLFAMYSAGNSGAAYFERQLLWLFFGLAFMIALSFFDYRILKNYSYPIVALYALAIFLLVGLFFFGSQIRGSVSWFQIGHLSFQPVESVKIILLIALAKYFSARHVEIYQWRHVVVSGLYAALPAGLVLVQPDFGSAAIIFFIWFGVMLAVGIKPKQLAVLALAVSMVAWVGWSYLLKDYQQERVLSFIAPQSDPLGAGYNMLQSTIAVGSGGLWGKGLGRGTQSQLNFLPEQHTDFIFAAVAEEWGFLGVLFLVALFITIFWRLLNAALLAGNNFAKLFISGFLILILAHSAINVGMNMGLLPITGISLPFVSYGGSNLLANFLALGLIQSIRVRYGSESDES